MALRPVSLSSSMSDPFADPMSTTEQLPPLKFLDNPFDSAPLPGNLRKKTISSCTSDSSGGSELDSLNLQVASSEIGTVIVDAKIDK
ncbi:hypothetical protein HDU82_004203, partial [Entophlyctis luteolus]